MKYKIFNIIAPKLKDFEIHHVLSSCKWCKELKFLIILIHISNIENIASYIVLLFQNIGGLLGMVVVRAWWLERNRFLHPTCVWGGALSSLSFNSTDD